jgi:hypothetical protein
LKKDYHVMSGFPCLFPPAPAERQEGMKVILVIAMAASIGWAEEYKVSVCIARAPEPAYLPRAEQIASKMFTPVRVKLVWRQLSGCPEDAIQIGLSGETPVDQEPGALAYALPYEGTHIVVFYDRVNSSVRGDLRAPLLAHVLVHEITHVLERIVRHSESGVMKAHWTGADYLQMSRSPLPFAEDDVQLIHLGLSKRAGLAASKASSQ